jgi:hypothetical protein
MFLKLAFPDGNRRSEGFQNNLRETTGPVRLVVLHLASFDAHRRNVQR